MDGSAMGRRIATSTARKGLGQYARQFYFGGDVAHFPVEVVAGLPQRVEGLDGGEIVVGHQDADGRPDLAAAA